MKKKQRKLVWCWIEDLDLSGSVDAVIQRLRRYQNAYTLPEKEFKELRIEKDFIDLHSLYGMREETDEEMRSKKKFDKSNIKERRKLKDERVMYLNLKEKFDKQ